MSRIARLPLLLVLAFAAASCGPTGRSVPLPGFLSGITGRAQAPDIRSQLSRESLDQVETPLILVELPTRGVAATLVPRTPSGPNLVWMTGDGTNLIFRNGVLVATRGLGDDLMGAEVDAAVDAIRNGGASEPVLRLYSSLDGLSNIETRSALCDYRTERGQVVEIFGRRHITQKVTERCFSADGNLENVFFIGQDGTIWQSRQWVSDEIGYVEIQRLVK